MCLHLSFSFSFMRCKNFLQLWLVKIFSQAVSAVSRACQTAAFDSDYNTWEYLQYLDLWLSGDCHFITSFSRHIDWSLFPSPRQCKSGPGPGSQTMEQCYKMKPNPHGPCECTYLQGAILLRTDTTRRCGHGQQQLCSVIEEQMEVWRDSEPLTFLATFCQPTKPQPIKGHFKYITLLYGQVT